MLTTLTKLRKSYHHTHHIMSFDYKLQSSEKRIQKDKRRQAEALKELDTLGSLSSLIVYTIRERKQEKHPNADYEISLRKGKQDSLPSGGLRSGSGNHYDRQF